MGNLDRARKQNIITNNDIGSTVQPYDETILKETDIEEKIKNNLAPHFLKDSDIGTKIQAHSETNVTDNTLNFQLYTDFEVHAIADIIQSANLPNAISKSGTIHIQNADLVFGWSSEFTFTNEIPQPMDNEMHLEYKIVTKKETTTIQITVL